MTKGDARRARKAGTLRDYALTGEPRPGMAPVRTAREERAHDARMERWARRYDALNGAPEGPEDC